MKKVISLALIISVIFVLSGVSMADSSVMDKIQFEVDKANAEIDSLIVEYIEKVDKVIKTYNHKISEYDDLEDDDDCEDLYAIIKLEKERDEKVDKLIQDLIDKTNAIAQAVFDKAASEGIEVICELVLVEIGGQEVWIDPIRIIGS